MNVQTINLQSSFFSQVLKDSERERLLDKLLANKDQVGWGVHLLSPRFISRSMYRRGKYNLNSMSHDTAADLIRKAMDEGVRVTEVFVDTVGPPDKYQAKLQALFPTLSITVAKKADSLYPVVSAASICAKVARDRALGGWRFAEQTFLADKLNSSWGSGYPGDPVTKRFLLDVDPLFGFPSIVRFSWKTAEKILDEKCLPMDFEEIEPEDEESVKRNPSVKNYFISAPKKTATAASSKTSSGPPLTKNQSKRLHPYFTERCLKIGELF
jgi:ribonuclease H2 subunit A